LQNLDDATASFEIYNSRSRSRLSRVLYGLLHCPRRKRRALGGVQFGDSITVAQIVIDQFIVAGPANGEETRLTLLLPHLY